MTLLALLAVAVISAATIGATAPSLAQRLPPHVAVRGLTAASLVSAAASGFVLSAIAIGALAQDRRVATLGHWSAPVLHRHDPLSTGVGLLAVLLVAGLLVRSVLFAAHCLRGLVDAQRVCRELGTGVDGLIVVDDPVPLAYAVQGYTGRIVISRTMLAALPADERRVLLAHERSHLRHRHSLLLALTQLAARANPLLTPAVDAVALGVERWADEDAAAATGRVPAARAIARAAMAARWGAPGPQTALAMASSNSALRARALLDPPPRPRRMMTAALAAVTTLAAGSAIVAERSTEVSFQQAHAATMHS